MKKIFLTLFLCLALAIGAYGSGFMGGGGSSFDPANPGNIGTGTPGTGTFTTLSGSNLIITTTLSLGTFTVATRPAATTANQYITVSDGNSANDCTTGGGANRVLCRSTGAIWEPVGDGNDGLPPGGSPGDLMRKTASGTEWTSAISIDFGPYDTYYVSPTSQTLTADKTIDFINADMRVPAAANVSVAGAVTAAALTAGLTSGGIIFGDTSPDSSGELGYDAGQLIFHDGTAARNVAKAGTLTNTKWCSSDGTVVNCTEDAPAGSGDITAVGSCVTGSCAQIGDGATGGGYLDFLEDSDNGTNYVRLKAPDTLAGDATVLLPSSAGTLSLNTISRSEFLPVAWMIDGAAAPAAVATVDLGTRQVKGRSFQGDTADQDLEMFWQAPIDIIDGDSGTAGFQVKWRPIYIITSATGPASGESVAFALQACSSGSGDTGDCTVGTASIHADEDLDAHVQYDIVYGAYTAITVTDGAAAEGWFMKLYRDQDNAQDDYAQPVSLVGIEIKYKATMADNY